MTDEQRAQREESTWLRSRELRARGEYLSRKRYNSNKKHDATERAYARERALETADEVNLKWGEASHDGFDLESENANMYWEERPLSSSTHGGLEWSRANSIEGRHGIARKDLGTLEEAGEIDNVFVDIQQQMETGGTEHGFAHTRQQVEKQLQVQEQTVTQSRAASLKAVGSDRRTFVDVQSSEGGNSGFDALASGEAPKSPRYLDLPPGGAQVATTISSDRAALPNEVKSLRRSRRVSVSDNYVERKIDDSTLRGELAVRHDGGGQLAMAEKEIRRSSTVGRASLEEDLRRGESKGMREGGPRSGQLVDESLEASDVKRNDVIKETDLGGNDRELEMLGDGLNAPGSDSEIWCVSLRLFFCSSTYSYLHRDACRTTKDRLRWLQAQARRHYTKRDAATLEEMKREVQNSCLWSPLHLNGGIHLATSCNRLSS
jgi:hypothetical protein